MASTTLRVSTEVRDRVNRLRERTRQSASEVLREALDTYEETLFWRQYALAANRVAADPAATSEEAAELELWERATTDGLERA